MSFCSHRLNVQINLFNYLTPYNIGILAPPFALIYYLATQFENNRKSLQQKLVEVQQLSQEKEQTLLQQNAELKVALLQGQTLERQRVAAHLHDNLGTTLTALQWSLDATDKSRLTPAERAVYATIREQVGQAYRDVQLLSHNLLPAELAKQGLAAALNQLVDKMNHNTGVRFRLTGAEVLPRLDEQTEFELYSIFLELLNNTVKHAQSTEGSVAFSLNAGRLLMTVSDNGKGVANQDTTGCGLQNVAARVASLSGALVINSQPGWGVENQITVPITTPARVSWQT